MIGKSVCFFVLLAILFDWEPAFAMQIHPHHQAHHEQQIPGEENNASEEKRFSNNSSEWIMKIRDATRKFRNFQVATREGYLPFGPDMPNMGEHFVNPSLAVKQEPDLLRPSVLTYLRVRDEMVLTGVAYTLPVQPGEYPPQLPFEDARWHYHSGNLIEEAHGLHDHSLHNEQSDKVRLGMVHAWVWMDNPAGFFEADNWALNYNRLGIEPVNEYDPAVSKTLFLLNGGVDYYIRFIKLAAKPDNEALHDFRIIMEKTRAEVEQIIYRRKEQGLLLPVDEYELIAKWVAMWDEIKKASNPQIWYAVSKYLTI
jgi:hypothetical protein